VLICIAKIDKDRVLSAFIVDSKSPGVVIGPDEHKMGIKGSSTARSFQRCAGAVENCSGKG
jgi:alkylation response protein AidB-like acyl-CoA dehydrogenase